MARGNPSGFRLKANDAPVILAMQARGDREHDIAAWFGVNQGRVAGVKDGKFGFPPLAQQSTLPPSGAPGVKGKRLRTSVARAVALIKAGKHQDALAELEKGETRYDTNEA